MHFVGGKLAALRERVNAAWGIWQGSPRRYTEISEVLPDLVTDLHAINSSLEAGGFGPHLLCSLVGFTGPSGQRLALVYLYKRGTFYPFAPMPGDRRDNALELQARGAVGADLPVEDDLSRWFPVWGAPGL